MIIRAAIPSEVSQALFYNTGLVFLGRPRLLFTWNSEYANPCRRPIDGDWGLKFDGASLLLMKDDLSTLDALLDLGID